MPYPDFLYYSDSLSVETFTEQPTGKISIQQMLHRQPDFWKTPVRLVKKLKTIIVTAGTAQFNEKMQQYIANLAKVTTVHLNTPPNYYMITSYDTNWSSLLKDVCLEHSDLMMTIACKQLKLTKEEIFILDDYWLTYLTSNFTPQNTFDVIDLDYFMRLETHKEEFLAIKKQYKDPKIIHVSEISDSSERGLNFLRSLFPDAKITYEIENFVLSAENIDIFEKMNKKACKSLELNDIIKDFSLGKQNIETLIFNGDSTDTYLINLLNQSSLNSLNIKFNRMQQSDEIKFNSKKTLKNLYIEESELPALFIKNLLTETTHLEVLSVTNTKLKGFTPPTLYNLKNLILERGSAITTQILFNFLKACSNIESLILNEEYFEEDEDFSSLQLTSLKKMELNSTFFIFKKVLNQLLKSAPNLENLSLKYRTFTNIEFTKAYPHLQHLILSNCKMEAKFLNTLPNYTPNLTTLDLNELEYSGELCLKENSWLILEEIVVSDWKTLKQLLKAAPNIKKIKFGINMEEISREAATLIFGDSKLEEYAWTELQEITISDMEIFKLILKAAPNLNRIQLEFENNFPVEETTKLIASHPTLKNYYANALRYCELNPGYTINLFAPDFLSRKKINRPYNLLHKNIENSTAPLHNPNHFQQQKPSTEDYEFQYKGLKDKQQSMVIEKLAQYAKLKKTHTELIYKIADGICFSLSQYFLLAEKFMPGSMDSLLTLFSKWDGQLDNLNDTLEKNLDLLWSYIKEHQFKQNINRQFVGEASVVIEYLQTLNPDEGILLENPWHTISLKKRKDSWTVYDPNFKDGPKTITDNELEKTIQDILGKLIFISMPNLNLTPKIKNANLFIKEGGLIALEKSTNQKMILKQLEGLENCELESLKGLVLRNTQGIPAWVLGLQQEQLIPLSLQLLQQYLQKNSNYISDLQNSLEVLNPHKKHEILATLALYIAKEKNISSDFTKTIDEIKNILRESPDIALYEQALRPQSSQKKLVSLLEESQLLLKEPGKKSLVKTSSSQEVQAIRFKIEQYATLTKRPLFYVHSPQDLVCSSSYIEPDKDNLSKGVIKEGPGGELYNFLKANQKNQPILLVNYDNFKAADLVRFNALLDPDKCADGTLLPPNTTIIGAMNSKKPNCYTGADFTSRFDEVRNIELQQSDITKILPELNIPVKKESDRSIPVNLFHCNQWKDILLGNWVLQGEALEFQDGILEQALKKNLPIEIQNGLWEDKTFQLFWREAIQHGEIRHLGRTFPLPKNFSLLQSEGYHWQALKSSIVLEDNNKAAFEVLNPERFYQFFSHQVFSEDKETLIYRKGLLETCKSSLSLYVTHSLSTDQWAKLLTQAKEHGVTLKVTLAQGVSLPQELNLTPTPKEFKPSIWNGTLTNVTVIESSDIETSVAQLTAKKEWIVLDVSELEANDLLESLEVNFSGKQFLLKQKMGALVKALKDEKPIILKGKFSSALEQQLAQVLLNHTDKKDASPLVIVTDNSCFAYLPTTTHTVQEQEKVIALTLKDNQQTESIKAYLKNESLNQLKARLHHLSLYPKTNSDDSWLGLGYLPLIKKLAGFNFSSSASEAKAFHETRIKAVTAALAFYPYVFLAGLSGVGKSTFVEKYLSQKPNTLLTLDQDSDHKTFINTLTQWAKCSNKEGHDYLFIDEATLSHREWTIFEGLFQNPKGILIEGTWYPLSSSHKVIFAGNPVSYGDERKLASFFEQHGNTLLFEPLSTAVLFEDILKPVFSKTKLEDHAAELSLPFLNVYCYLVFCSEQDVLISPRELQMMALLTLSYCKTYPNADKKAVAAFYAYQIARPLVPTLQQAQFDSLFKSKDDFTTKVKLNKDKFLLTNSRIPLASKLQELITLRDFRQTASNPVIQYGGLGGIIIEGEPGVGKSELVTEILISNGFQEMKGDSLPDKPFCRIPVSMGLEERKKLFLKAFHAGAIVICDEINSSPMLERFLNSLLMGKTPDGNPPKKPGFLLIGTQNPTTMDGRKAASTALSRRLITEILPVYPEKELVQIIVSKGLSTTKADGMAKVYLQQFKKAQQESLIPPNFRNLVRLVDKVKSTSSSDVKEDSKDIPELLKKDSLELSQIQQTFFVKRENDQKDEKASTSIKPIVKREPTISFHSNYGMLVNHPSASESLDYSF